MLTYHERAIKANAAFAVQRQADPVKDMAWKKAISHGIKLYWNRRHKQQAVTPAERKAANGSNGNGHGVVGRHTGLTKAMLAIDAQIVSAQEQVTALQARRRLLEAAQTLIKETVQ